jgi:hypothetical protein
MTMHHDHVTDNEDAAFDTTVKISGSVIAALVIACAAFWYLYA